MDIFPTFGFFTGLDFPKRLNLAVVGLPVDQQHDVAASVAHPTFENGYGLKDGAFWVQGKNHRYVFHIAHLLPQTPTVEIGVAFARQEDGLIAIEGPVYVAFFVLTNGLKPVQ